MSSSAARQKALRATRRGWLVEMLGGVCAKCGSTDRLEFDHIDPTTKSFSIAKGRHRGLRTLLAEVEKVQLLCHACHWSKTLAARTDPLNGNGRQGRK